jgi:phytoene synthase
MATDLDDAFEACRRETAEWAKTFYLGTLLLPLEKRRAIWAIYVWCRRTDELMDSAEAQSRSVEELAERLDHWEQQTRDLFNGHVSNDLDAVMAHTLERFPQDIQPYLDMIEGQRMDLTWTRYPTFEDLKLYCYRVAGTVGLMTQGVMGVDQAYTSAPWSDSPDTSDAGGCLGDRKPAHEYSSRCW